MIIIEIEARENNLHNVESQSHRTSVWMDGYIAVPPELESDVWASGGYCDLEIVDGVLVSITPTAKPDPEPQPQPGETDTQVLNALLGWEETT